MAAGHENLLPGEVKLLKTRHKTIHTQYSQLRSYLPAGTILRFLFQENGVDEQ